MKKGKRQWYKEVGCSAREDYYFLLEWIDERSFRVPLVIYKGTTDRFASEIYAWTPEDNSYKKCDASEAIAHLL